MRGGRARELVARGPCLEDGRGQRVGRKALSPATLKGLTQAGKRAKVRAARLIDTADAPETHGRPMPRATTAAWLVIPPRAVKIPRAACIP